jgi:hypothetical protein
MLIRKSGLDFCLPAFGVGSFHQGKEHEKDR